MISENRINRTNPTTYAFEEFTLEAENLLLLRNSEVVSLAPKAVEVLRTLIEARGKMLTKQEILERVWTGTFVEEANLTHHISALRKALGEDKNGRKFIETIPRRGYRFVAPIVEANHSALEIVFSERITDVVREEIEIETGADPTVKQTARIPDSKNEYLRQNRFVKIAVAATCFLLMLFGGAAIYQFISLSRQANAPNDSAAPISYTRVGDGRDAGCTTISSDGKFVAYVQNYNAGEGGTLFIRQTETNREMRLLEPDERTFGNIEFSPDNSLLYYVSFEKNSKAGAIYSIPIFGGKPKRLLNLDWISAYFTVSPDNQRIAFYRNDAETHTTSLVVASLGGEAVERIIHTHPDSEPSFWGQIAWSPDNRSLAVIRVSTSETQYDSRIFKLDLQTGESAPMHDQGFAEIGKLRFSSDQSKIFFIGRTDSSTQKIYVLDIAGRQIRRVTNDTNGYGNYGLGITSDGKTLSADLFEMKSDLWSMAADGNSSDAVRVKPGETNGRRGLAALGDSRIAYLASFGDKYGIWSVKTDGTDAQQLTDDKFEERGLAASPDGRLLVFSSNRAGGKHLFRLNSDGSDLTQLTFGDTTDEQPDFSSDGKWIVYISKESGVTTVKKIAVAGGIPIQLTDYFGVMPTFSPDGKYIALKFLSGTRSQPSEIAVITADGGKPLKTFAVADFEWFPAITPIRWTPDGKAIVFRRERNSVSNLWRQDLDGSPARQITNFTSDAIYNFVYSPDKTRILLSRGLYQTSPVMIKNF